MQTLNSSNNTNKENLLKKQQSDPKINKKIFPNFQNNVKNSSSLNKKP